MMKSKMLEGGRSAAFSGNRFDRMEWAGAFGDLGTLIPFVVAYISLLKVDPYGVILAFGIANICAGFYYRTPVPVQPMKAIGAVATTQAAQTAVMTPDAVYGAGLVTGIVWLVLGVTGTARKVANLVGRPVAIGIIMGLGFSFMLEGIKMMAQGWILGAVALAGTLLLLTNRVIPAMLLLLLFGAAAAVFQNPILLREFSAMEPGLRLPSWQLGSLTWNELLIGTLFLALPQIPLTLGNAVIAITEENNRLFPERRISENGISVSTGLMNIFGSTIGAIPMCHGAGGMAAHVRFGAHTGGATIILGVFLVGLALFFSGSIGTIFGFLPTPVLGVILFLTGSQLALGSCDFGEGKNDRFVTLTTAAFSIWNIGLAFLFGMAMHHALKRGWVRL